MLRRHKNHITLFFALLVVMVQLSNLVHVISDLFDEHSHSACCYFEEQGSVNFDTYTIGEISFSETHDCIICQQFQKINFYFVSSLGVSINKCFSNIFKLVVFRSLLTSNFLLDNVSLRAPPTLS